MKVIKLMVYTLTKEFKYFAKVIKDRGRFFYQVDGMVIEITKYEYDHVIINPYLYYFSSALKLHIAIQRKKRTVILLENLIK